MSTPPIDTDVMALANMHFEDCKTVHKFMAEVVRSQLDRHAAADASGAVRGAFLRAQAWLGTFHKLDNPAHFQAVIAGTRSLFEIAVDLAFLHYSRTEHPPERMQAWERSGKLRAAERTRDFYAANPGLAMPDHLQERILFIGRFGAQIGAERARWWNGRHAERWTGQNLRLDAATADTLAPLGFREFYDVRFAELCWGTHGSGLTGFRELNVEYFPGPVVMAFEDAAKLAITASKLALRYFAAFDAIAEERFRLLEAEREHWRLRAFAAQKQKGPASV